MSMSFYRTTELNGSSSVKGPLRSSAILNTKSDFKNCFLCFILLIHILVKIVTLREYQNMDDILIDQAFKDSFLRLDLNVVLYMYSRK